MHSNNNALREQGGNSNNVQPYYTKLDNILISLVIWEFLPFVLVDWFINRGGKNYD